MLWLKVVVGIYYELCILEWLHSCQVEAWPNIYSRFLFFLLKMYKEESFEFWISLFTFVCLSTHFLQKSYSFPSFPNFILLCNISDCCLVTCIAPSTLGFSKKPCVWKGGWGGGNTKAYGIIYIEQSVCNAVSEQRWCSAASLPAIGRYYFMNFSLCCWLNSFQFHKHWAIPTDVTQ